MIYFNTGQSRFNSSKSSTNVKIVRISKYHFFSITSPPPKKNKNLKLKTKISQQISDFKHSLNRLIKNSYFLSFFSPRFIFSPPFIALIWEYTMLAIKTRYLFTGCLQLSMHGSLSCTH